MKYVLIFIIVFFSSIIYVVNSKTPTKEYIDQNYVTKEKFESLRKEVIIQGEFLQRLDSTKKYDRYFWIKKDSLTFQQKAVIHTH